MYYSTRTKAPRNSLSPAGALFAAVVVVLPVHWHAEIGTCIHAAPAVRVRCGVSE